MENGQTATPARVLTYANDFREYIAEIEKREPLEIDEEMYWYFLEVLPPVDMGGSWKRPDGQVQRYNFAFAEGADFITIFWESPKGRFFAQLTNRMARGN